MNTRCAGTDPLRAAAVSYTHLDVYKRQGPDNRPADLRAADENFERSVKTHHGTDGNDLHVFGYHGVPSTYRIILVTQSGKVWLSDELERRVLQSSVTVHWADDPESTTVTVPSTVTRCV